MAMTGEKFTGENLAVTWDSDDIEGTQIVSAEIHHPAKLRADRGSGYGSRQAAGETGLQPAAGAAKIERRCR